MFGLVNTSIQNLFLLPLLPCLYMECIGKVSTLGTYIYQAKHTSGFKLGNFTTYLMEGSYIVCGAHTWLPVLKKIGSPAHLESFRWALFGIMNTCHCWMSIPLAGRDREWGRGKGGGTDGWQGGGTESGTQGGTDRGTEGGHREDRGDRVGQMGMPAEPSRLPRPWPDQLDLKVWPCFSIAKVLPGLCKWSSR